MTNCPLDPTLKDVLTQRAPYKMYEITASSNRWLHLSRLLTSSVTEPPLHSCKRRCRGERQQEHTYKKKRKKTLRKAHQLPTSSSKFANHKTLGWNNETSHFHCTVKSSSVCVCVCVYLFKVMT